MKSFNLITAALLVVFGFGSVSVVRADETPAPVDSADELQPETLDVIQNEYAPAYSDGKYADFPSYGPGFSSYRGLGFMGSCCEQNSCRGQYAWNGYCEQKGCSHPKPFHGWADKLRCHLKRPACCATDCCDKGCGQKGGLDTGCCDAKPLHGFHGKLHWGWPRPAVSVKGDCCTDSCCDVKPCLWDKLRCGLHRPKCGTDPCCDSCPTDMGGKSCAAQPKWHTPLCGKLHGLLGHGGGGWFGIPFQTQADYYESYDGKVIEEPTYAEPIDSDQPLPEPTPEVAPELPPAPSTEPSVPEVTTDYIPEFPDFTANDRSARRNMLRRLPDVSVNY